MLQSKFAESEKVWILDVICDLEFAFVSLNFADRSKLWTIQKLISSALLANTTKLDVGWVQTFILDMIVRTLLGREPCNGSDSG